MENYWISKLDVLLKKIPDHGIIVFQAEKEFKKMQTQLATSFAVFAEGDCTVAMIR